MTARLATLVEPCLGGIVAPPTSDWTAETPAQAGTWRVGAPVFDGRSSRPG